MMMELMLLAAPTSGLGAGLATGMTAGMVIGKLGPLVTVLAGLVFFGWLVRQMLFKPTPLDAPLPDTRTQDDQLIRERYHPRASDLLGRRPRV